LKNLTKTPKLTADEILQYMTYCFQKLHEFLNTINIQLDSDHTYVIPSLAIMMYLDNTEFKLTNKNFYALWTTSFIMIIKNWMKQCKGKEIKTKNIVNNIFDQTTITYRDFRNYQEKLPLTPDFNRHIDADLLSLYNNSFKNYCMSHMTNSAN
jgi:hypothetical protein